MPLTLDHSGHQVRLLILGMPSWNQKSAVSSRFGNRPLTSCHPARCQGKSSHQVSAARTCETLPAGAAVRGQGCSTGGDAAAAQRSTAHSAHGHVCLAGDAAQADASEQLFGRNLVRVCPALSFARSCISSSLTQVLLCLFKCICF